MYCKVWYVARNISRTQNKVKKWEVVINTIHEKTQKLELHEQGKNPGFSDPKTLNWGNIWGKNISTGHKSQHSKATANTSSN